MLWRFGVTSTPRSDPVAARAYIGSPIGATANCWIRHLEPSLQALHRRRFEETAVYLDTNLLVAVILPEHPTHEAAVALARLCTGAGLKLGYSGRTSEELEALIESADRDYAAHPPFD